MAPTTTPSTTKTRISAPFASLINSCAITRAFNPLNASKTDSAALSFSAKTTPKPCVPSNNFITKGVPPTLSITSLTFLE